MAEKKVGNPTPDGNGVKQKEIVLKQGQIAVYSQPNYAGRQWIITGDVFSLAATELENSARSIKLGPNTHVVLHSGVGFTGNLASIKGDIGDYVSPYNFWALSIEIIIGSSVSV